MNKIKSFLAMLLAICLVFSVFPIMPQAASEPVVVIAASDYQNTNGGLFSSGASTDAYAILDRIQDDYATADGFLFGGDYYAHATNTTTESTNGKNQLDGEIVDALYPDMADEKQIYIQGNHDADSLTTNGTLSTSGAHDTDSYGVYVINEKDYMWYNDNQSAIRNTAASLETYLNAKLTEGYNKPIFILSHLPLHYTNRTKNEGDGKYAKYIYDVLDEAGKNDLNIIFLYGHNHSTAYDSYLGNGSVYLAEGDSISVANEGSTTSYFTDTLTFTYMNYGFVGYIGNSNADSELTMTVFEITDSEVTVSRYDENGIHNLKSEGGSTQLPSGLTVDNTVYESGQIISLTTPTYEAPVASITIGEGTTIYRLVNQFSDGRNYILANSNSAGSAYAIQNSIGTEVGATAVTIKEDSEGAYIETNDNSALWNFINDENMNSVYDVTAMGDLKNLATDNYLNVSISSSDTENYTQASGVRYRDFANSNVTYSETEYYYRDTGGSYNRVYVSRTRNGNYYTYTLYTRSAGSYNQIWSGRTRNISDQFNAIILYTKSSNETINYSLTTTAGLSDDYTSWRIASNNYGMYTLQNEDNTATRYYVDYYNNLFNVTTGSSTGRVYIYEEVKDSGMLTVSLDTDSGSVKKSASSSASTGSVLTITDSAGNKTSLKLTLGMLKDADGNAVSVDTIGTLTGLEVYYTHTDGVEYLVYDNYSLTIRELNDYPEYPDEGSVNVNKTATGVDFQKTGVAKVELSAAGVPVKKGADVIVMLDTSSSMTRAADSNSSADQGEQRIDYLQTAVAELITQFQAVGEDGETQDIRIAVADFNGYTHISNEHHLEGTTVQTSSNTAQIFTGDKEIGVGAFVQASTIENPETFASQITAKSGTNYDYAFESVYRLGAAIQEENEANGEVRDLFVIFMSDGAPYQFNYYGSQSSGNSSSDPEENDMARWNYWITGTIDEYVDSVDYDPMTTWFSGSPNKHFYNADGKHWTAEAIKGDTSSYYDVIDAHENLNGLESSKGNYFEQVSGLGATMYTLGFCLYDDYGTTEESMETLLKNLASTDANGTPLYTATKDGEGLASAFATIGNEIAYAATNAYFVDTMGAGYSLQLANTVTRYNEDGSVDEVITLNESPQIVVKEYDIYTRADYEAGTITEDKIGDRKTDADGNYIYTVKETVTFNADGTKAYSNGDETNNILIDGVICADTFWYNTTGTAKLIDVDGEGTAEYSLAAETFYWKIGTITNKEIALSYYVYLSGSMEGALAAGSYPTNESAVLYYKNWLGNDAHKDTVSPVLAWESANVSYAFYLVDENGNIIVNQTTGQTGSFANKIAVTNPVVYEEVYLNDEAQVKSINVASMGVLPEGYELYDDDSTYTIEIDSDSTGSWNIGKNSSLVNSTYVTGYRGNEYSNALIVDENGYDYTHTTVWFAVVFKIGTLPDSVVIDYGLPVNINVLGNDMFGDYGTLAAVGNATFNEDNKATWESSEYPASYNAIYGKAEVSNGKVKYTPDTSDAMQMSTVDTFNYAVNYTGPANAGYYYGNVTVIPAAMVYYEENFVTFTNSTATSGDFGIWKDEGTVDFDAVQAEDRPGTSSLTSYDANNVYGYDAAYSNFTQYSLGGAKKVTVDAATGKASTAPTATFKFTGTGFDVISLTDYDSGLIVVTVRDENGTVKKRKTVDNYYGYTYSDGEWVVDTTSTGTIWQVPVIKIEGLDYATYDVTIQVAYMSSADHRADGSYSFWLDAIRVYDQAKEDETAIKAYIADDEYDPYKFTLRDLLVGQSALSVETTTGVVFIDGIDDNYAVATYADQGPNNEVYLDYNQGISFKLQTAVKPENVQLGVKLADGNSATLMKNDTELVTVSTATDMYYKLNLSWKETADGYESEVITLSNASDTGIISLTNLKYAYEYVAPVVSSYSLRAVVNEETANEGIALMRALYMPPEVFEPEYTSTKWKAGKANKNSTLTVTTSEDVQYISVNGQIIDKYITVPEISFENWSLSISFKRVWIYSEKITETGTYEYDIVFYNEEDVASDVVVAELVVAENIKKEKRNGKKGR